MPESVSINAHFEIPTDGGSVRTEDQKFDASNSNIAVIGIDEPKKPQAGDYSYSGMHDQGPLPASKEGGPYAQLIGCLAEAKRASDALLTNVIKNEGKRNNKKKV